MTGDGMSLRMAGVIAMKLAGIKNSLTNGMTRNIYLLGLLSFFNDFTSEMISPLLPIYLAGMGLGASFLGLMEGLANFLCYLTMLVSGILADRYQKNEGLTFWGYRICAWIRLLFAIPHPAPVLSARLIDRIGKGVRTAPRDRLITAYIEKKFWGKGAALPNYSSC
jgi:MFS family permease